MIGPVAIRRNADFSSSVSLAMDVLEFGEFVLEIENVEDEIKVEGGPLDTAERHRHAADQGETDAGIVEVGDDLREYALEVHGEGGWKS